MSKVAALYVQRGGVYWDLPDVDAWDEERDARLYAGPWPVVAHPPCARWCRLAPINEKRYGQKVGDDGGCFAAALSSVRTWGGCLEHPAGSRAWAAFGLVPPSSSGAWTFADCRGGLTCYVEQGHFEHRARKGTWIYAWGVKPPSLGFFLGAATPTATVSFLKNHGGGSLPRLSKREAKTTPLPFRDLLLSIARSARASEAA
jgi:hypothetical protein